MIKLTINSVPVEVAEGTTLAVAILASDVEKFRTSVAGQPRGPLCGMGTCFDCRVTINGLKHQRSCTRLVEEAMEIVTDE
ncbi:MAG TPA: (2Fe-2S)-binding protein [Pyrinomonadaceae bacterium]|nr:(2Fe-2S)-binding protein [Pyrinomonadaceae bacterium]